MIPHVIEVDLKKELRIQKNLTFHICPSCGSETIKEFNNVTKKYDAVRRCISEGFDCEK